MPLNAVSGIFAKETGYGFAFTVATDPVASLANATAPKEVESIAASGKSNDAEVKPKRPSHLQIIK